MVYFPGRIRMPNLAAAPATPAKGEMYFDTALNTLFVYNGTAWVAATSNELVYAQFTAAVTVSATVETGATSVVNAGAFTFDGATPVIISFFCPAAIPVAAAGGRLDFWLYQDSASIGRLAVVISTAAPQMATPVFTQRRMTPASGSRTYAIGATQTGGNGTLQAGPGGLGSYVPGFIRIERAV